MNTCLKDTNEAKENLSFRIGTAPMFSEIPGHNDSSERKNRQSVLKRLSLWFAFLEHQRFFSSSCGSERVHWGELGGGNDRLWVLSRLPYRSSPVSVLKGRFCFCVSIPNMESVIENILSSLPRTSPTGSPRAYRARSRHLSAWPRTRSDALAGGIFMSSIRANTKKTLTGKSHENNGAQHAHTWPARFPDQPVRSFRCRRPLALHSNQSFYYSNLSSGSLNSQVPGLQD